MLKYGLVLLAATLLSAGAANAAPPLVNPVTVPIGGAVHLTPHTYDATGVEVALAGATCTIIGWPSGGALPATLVTVSYDATGANIAAVSTTGGTVQAQWQCANAGKTVFSTQFSVTVPSPWTAVAVGDTSP